MNDINEQIQELVKNNLPEAQALAFKEYIEKSEFIKGEYEKGCAEIVKLKDSVLLITQDKKKLQDQIREHADIDQEKKELKAERAKFEDEKRDLKVTILEAKLADACTMVNAQQNLVESIFKHGSTRDMMLSGAFSYSDFETDTNGYTTMNKNVNGNMNASVNEITPIKPEVS